MTDFRKEGAEILRVVESSTDPSSEAGRVLVYGKNSGGATKLFTRDSAGAISQVGASGATPSVVIVDDIAGYTNTNVSTLGTIDWFIPTNSEYANQWWAKAPNTLWYKRGGGCIAESFRYFGIFPYGGVAFSALTITGDAGDSADSMSALNFTSASGVQNTGVLGMGFNFRVPAVSTQMVLRIYLSTAATSSGVVTVRARLLGTGTTATNVWNIGAGDASCMTITYNAVFGDVLSVDVQMTAGTGVMTMLIPAITLGLV